MTLSALRRPPFSPAEGAGRADPPARNDAPSRRAIGAIERSLGRFAIHDLVLLGHLVAMWTLAVSSTASAARSVVMLRLEGCIALLVAGCMVGRGTRLPPRVRAVVYRVVVVGVVLASYLMLRDALPVIQPGSVDATLDAVDRAIFGVRPTVWLELRMSPYVVEYFSFFYLSYFALCALLAVVTLGPHASPEASAEFTVGTSIVYGLGQLGYVAVPGFGPARYLESVYRGPLAGGPLWNGVVGAVEAGGAFKDIFPSIHAGAAVWFALFVVRRARRTKTLGWRVLAACTAVFAVHIAISTVVLRWHYTLDVLAGCALGLAAAVLAPRLVALERRVRAARGLPPAWE